MADGSQQAIGTLKPGMSVAAWNEHTREYSNQEIENVHVIEKRPIIKVTLVDHNGNQADEIYTTSDHPFFVDGKGWVTVDSLEAGDQVLTANDDASGALLIKSVTREGYAETTYNLTVANAHTFFVGDKSVWVHNQSSHDFFFGQTRISQSVSKLSISPIVRAGKLLQITERLLRILKRVYCHLPTALSNANRHRQSLIA